MARGQMPSRPQNLSERPPRPGRRRRSAPTFKMPLPVLENTMSMQAMAAAMQRIEAVLERRPEKGLHDDAPATASWQGGTRVLTRHGNGTDLATDMPPEFAGSGDDVTPGWLFRAGIASCATTSIALQAANQGISLSRLEVKVSSRSDLRGVFGMTDVQGELVPAGPLDVELSVRIAADDVSADRLRALVESSCQCSYVPAAVRRATPLAVRIDVGGD
jgi:uncharacterized OsmC-like protein